MYALMIAYCIDMGLKKMNKCPKCGVSRFKVNSSQEGGKNKQLSNEDEFGLGRLNMDGPLN